MQIFKGRVKGKVKECDGGHLDYNYLISRCWIRGRVQLVFLSNIRGLNKSINYKLQY